MAMRTLVVAVVVACGGVTAAHADTIHNLQCEIADQGTASGTVKFDATGHVDGANLVMNDPNVVSILQAVPSSGVDNAGTTYFLFTSNARVPGSLCFSCRDRLRR